MRILVIATCASVLVTAPTSGQKVKLEDLMKPYEAKAKPPDPNAPAPSGPTHPVPMGPSVSGYGTVQPANTSKSLLDGCVISAIGRLPKADGLRVTNSSYEFRNTFQQWEFWRVSVSVELAGRQASYQWLCRIYANSSAELLNAR